MTYSKAPETENQTFVLQLPMLQAENHNYHLKSLKILHF